MVRGLSRGGGVLGNDHGAAAPAPSGAPASPRWARVNLPHPLRREALLRCAAMQRTPAGLFRALGVAAAQPSRDAEAADDGDTARILHRWLFGLRAAVFGLLLPTLPLSERLLGFHVRYALALPAVLVVAGVNAAAVMRARAGRPATRGSVALGVALDMVGIAAVLACAGGAANPFSALLLVHVALAASILPVATTFALTGLSACLFAALFAVPSGACCPSHPSHGAFSTHLYGMWTAFVLSAAVIAYFVTRVREALEARGREIGRLRREAEQNARLYALGTLAAGTAHELGTPLSTIAVLAGELAELGGDDGARRQAAAIGAQVERCRRVITRMQAGAAPLDGQAPLVSAVERALAAWRAAHPQARVTLRLQCGSSAIVPLPAEEVEAALGALLDNAHFATRAARSEEPIAVTVRPDDQGFAVVVEDSGTGVPQALRDRVGEPFLTTKEPGEGMGLGLYLVRRAVERAGGGLDVGPRAPRGARAVLRFRSAEARS
jgi:two-component system sensor histidine kinase RegB